MKDAFGDILNDGDHVIVTLSVYGWGYTLLEGVVNASHKNSVYVILTKVPDNINRQNWVKVGKTIVAKHENRIMRAKPNKV